MINSEQANAQYIQLNKLLDEICYFLLEDENLSNTQGSRSRANEIIKKIHTQKKELAEWTEKENESYVDMQGESSKPANIYIEFENPKDEIYYAIGSDNGKADKYKTLGRNSSKYVCPYKNRKYKDFINCRHRGVLEKRDKFLFFETYKSYIGLIFEDYLLLYQNESATQAAHTYNLKEYEKGALDEHPKTFFIENNNKHTKHVFLAESEEEKYQWMVAISNTRAPKNEIMTDSGGYSESITNLYNTLGKNYTINTDAVMDPPNENQQLIEEVEEDDYDRIVNSPSKHSNDLTARNKPPPVVPRSLSAPPPGPKPPAPAVPKRTPKASTRATVIPAPSFSNDSTDEEPNDSNNIEVTGLYDTICVPRPPRHRAVKPHSVDVPSVHPSFANDLNLVFSNQYDRAPLMKKDRAESRSAVKPQNRKRSIAASDISSEITGNFLVSKDDIYDSIVNLYPLEARNMKAQALDELKSRFSQDRTAPKNAQYLNNRGDDDLKKPIINAQVKIEKSKSIKRMLLFFRPAAVTKVV